MTTTNTNTGVDGPEGLTIAEAKEQIQDRFEAAHGTEIAHDPGEQQEQDEAPKGPNAEAAKYRRQLREAEAERDQTAAELNQARQMILGQHLHEHTIRTDEGNTLQLHPKALEELTLSRDLFDGLDLNGDAVTEYFTQLYTERPYIFHPVTHREEIRSQQPRPRLRGGSNPYDEPAPAGEKFKAAFRPGKK